MLINIFKLKRYYNFFNLLFSILKQLIFKEAETESKFYLNIECGWSPWDFLFDRNERCSKLEMKKNPYISYLCPLSKWLSEFCIVFIDLFNQFSFVAQFAIIFFSFSSVYIICWAIFMYFAKKIK